LVAAQFLGALLSTVSTGVVLPRFGFRRTISSGLLFMGTGVAALLAGPFWWAIIAVFCYGTGIGLIIPTGNLLVSQVVSKRSSSALNLLNFSWSAGAVACPFLLAAFQYSGHTKLFLYGIAVVLALLISVVLAVPIAMPEPRPEAGSAATQSRLHYLKTPAALILGTLFFVYVGTENALGAWLASYAKRVTPLAGTGWITVPSYFYGALLLGRVVAPLTLRRISDAALACAGAVLASLSCTALLFARSVPVIAFCAWLAGLGMSSLYPITIGFLSSRFGTAASRVAGVMFALSTLGGASVPWLVGYESTQLNSLRAALLVPLAGCLLMLMLFSKLAEVRRDTVEKSPNSFRMSLGSCEVCTTFGKRFQTFRQTEAELVQ
jgi:fucose permease